MSWFGRLLGGKSPGAQEPTPGTPRTQELPPEGFTSARRASREVLRLAMAALQDERGIHLESLYCALGALAGRACQASVSERARSEGKPAEALFAVATTTDGHKFYFGDALNQPLAEDRVSVWSLVAGAAAHEGAGQLPDLDEIFKHNATVLGSEHFGVPRLPAGHPVHARPLDYARKLWPEARKVVAELVGDPRLWPVAIGLAIQELMAQAKGQVPADIVARIVMESAIPVSKVPIED